ncbi:hypothetical protein A2851_02795 [Candidatus Kaiserbacteria bacterium RIFCSPHIGHO2_01_FULL_53_29]|uniref:Uncharacterized protein n=1 Tax=Candidatus Kaiserbacteria bacterium RIFCSPHIGHO2_01_FULL_53_29 TaxID=1798480 RepID=A0A1F6CVM7_9BACT|nr:MAG: hypothetical protein A2851_02795 [Candidatus Kaiserbacteria bacterium RIFCSPHIGHO2_01_FULL_53_29]
MEVDMSKKHVEFGKDLGLMAEVVRRGLSVGIGQWEFWEPLSKPQPGLWHAMIDFFGIPPHEYFDWCESWKSEKRQNHHHRAPDIDTLDAVVRYGRENGFTKENWQHLIMSASVFEALVDYLRLAPPFSVEVEVDYSHLPPYQGGYTPQYPLRRSHGVARLDMSIYVLADDRKIDANESRIRERGWRFADQQELYAFGQTTKQQVRPWAVMGVEPLYGPGSRTSDFGHYHFPRLWMLRGNDALDHYGCTSVASQSHNGLRTLIVKE